VLVQERAQVLHARGDRRIGRSERFLAHREGASQRRVRGVQLALLLVREAEMVDRVGTLRGGERLVAARLLERADRPGEIAAVEFVKLRPDFNGKVGAVGFCFGGGIANLIATRHPDLGGAVPYYGMQPPAEEAAKIKCPMLIHYASEDQRINAGWPAFEKVLKEHHVEYQASIYPGTQHGFHNDTTPRYDEAAAKLSWQRTLEFFETHLRA
jgi:carboxymethylenebutenolidase